MDCLLLGFRKVSRRAEAPQKVLLRAQCSEKEQRFVTMLKNGHFLDSILFCNIP